MKNSSSQKSAKVLKFIDDAKARLKEVREDKIVVNTAIAKGKRGY